MTLPKLRLRREGKLWFITGLDPYQDGNETLTEVGPFDSRAEASASRDNMLEVYREMQK